ncbi:MAG: Indolepyruvate oxidoreductase subunit IorA [Candidatus Syntrophoarchaeum sp. GoM_oil]|nr:MAG: Indolepyruvate oxidoreductase subunit IorA [Candidatus Syntrophoarchaeum sp. GoM_oil]
MGDITINKPGGSLFLLGNEAIARGAIEAGVDFVSAYPGTPSSEIVDTLSKLAPGLGFYAEWSVNEKVALEAAAAASYSGLRALCTMKSQGLNVASDFLLTQNLTGSKGGYVLVVCDDPSALSSVNEEDTRSYARLADLPMLEPATIQEAKDMTRYAFELSEELGCLVIIKSVTRISHARGRVILGEIARQKRRAFFDVTQPFLTGVGAPVVRRHERLHKRLELIREEFERSNFNSFDGDRGDPDLLIVTNGSTWLYAKEAVEMLGLGKRVGILKLGCTHPLPEGVIEQYLNRIDKVLVLEEVDPLLERDIAVISNKMGRLIRVYGRMSDHLPGCGELNVDLVLGGISKILEVSHNVDYRYREMIEDAASDIPPRELAFCPGCPHRASFWVIKTALELDGRGGFVAGDIGCYTLGMYPTGFELTKTSHCMGAGIGLSSGFRFLNQPVITLAGDSTFFHACIPGLINAKFNKANLLLCVLDNSATAMTGFQPHPGTGKTAMGEDTDPVSIEAICTNIGANVEVADPFEIDDAIETLYRMLQQDGLRVLILRQMCGILRARSEGRKKIYVDQEKCIGDECGCARFCSRVFNCPGIIWDEDRGRAMIDEAVCTGCGLCAKLCPEGAIVVEEVFHEGSA